MAQPPGYPPGYPPNTPPGYPPAPGYPQPPMMYYGVPQTPQRSGIPKVVGIIAIVFSVLGLGWAAIFGFGPMSDIDTLDDIGVKIGPMKTWILVWLGLSAVLFVLHLVGGILSIGYKPAGRTLLNVYAIVALVLAIADCGLMFALLPSDGELGIFIDKAVKEEIVYPRIAYEVFAIVWPIIVLALMNGAKVKDAVSGPRPA